MTGFVIVPITQDAQSREAASQLAALGYRIGSVSDAQGRQMARARKLVVLWSRAARGTPALRAAARKAKAQGKLVCVRLDSALPPAEIGGTRALRLPNGRLRAAALKTLLQKPRSAVPISAPLKQRTPARRATRRRNVVAAKAPAPVTTNARTAARLFSSLAALALIVLAAGAEAYARDATFASRLHDMAGDAQARAMRVVSDLASR